MHMLKCLINTNGLVQIETGWEERLEVYVL